MAERLVERTALAGQHLASRVERVEFGRELLGVVREAEGRAVARAALEKPGQLAELTGKCRLGGRGEKPQVVGLSNRTAGDLVHADLGRLPHGDARASTARKIPRPSAPGTNSAKPGTR